MNITDLRKVPYEFGSPEWLDYMKRNNIDCPEFDRRKADKCKDDQQPLTEADSPEKKQVRLLLTPEERKLIQDMYLNDLG